MTRGPHIVEIELVGVAYFQTEPFHGNVRMSCQNGERHRNILYVRQRWINTYMSLHRIPKLMMNLEYLGITSQTWA